MLRPTTVLALIVALISFPRLVGATESSVPFIEANLVHNQGFTGQGVTVALIDTGIHYNHPGLAGSIASGGMSWIYGQPVYDDGVDPDPPGESHGTYMSLIITDETGVAPDALILPVRVATDLDIELAIEYVTNRRQTVDPTIRVNNISMGSWDFYFCSCDGDWPDMYWAVSSAASSGIVTFAATGNESECYDGICAPACVSSAVRVAADYDGNYPSVHFPPPADCMDVWPDPYWVTCFSNVTEDCDWFLAAPGYDITVGGYSGDGTSQATAHCSGVAALMFSKGPCSMNGWTARQTIWWNALTHEWAWPYCPLPPQPRHLNAFNAVGATFLFACIRGDMNCDGDVDSFDVDPFVLALTDPPGYTTAYPHCNRLNGDINCDGSVDSFDLDPFVVCVMLGECPPCP